MLKSRLNGLEFAKNGNAIVFVHNKLFHQLLHLNLVQSGLVDMWYRNMVKSGLPDCACSDCAPLFFLFGYD